MDLNQLSKIPMSWWATGAATLAPFTPLRKPTVELFLLLLKTRIPLVTSYRFTGQTNANNEISILNLSKSTIHVSNWSISWKPRIRWFWKRSIHLTPYDCSPPYVNQEDVITEFFIPSEGKYIITIPNSSRFDWSHRSAGYRQLFLKLYIFGRRSRTFKIGAGQ